MLSRNHFEYLVTIFFGRDTPKCYDVMAVINKEVLPQTQGKNTHEKSTIACAIGVSLTSDIPHTYLYVNAV